MKPTSSSYITSNTMAPSMQVRKTAMREVGVLQRLQHDNIVRLLDVFRIQKKLYLVFEYMQGTVLQVILSCQNVRTRCIMSAEFQLGKCDVLDEMLDTNWCRNLSGIHVASGTLPPASLCGNSYGRQSTFMLVRYALKFMQNDRHHTCLVTPPFATQ